MSGCYFAYFSHIPTLLTNCLQGRHTVYAAHTHSDSSHVTAPYKVSFYYYLSLRSTLNISASVTTTEKLLYVT